MRVAIALLIVALAAGVNSCRHGSPQQPAVDSATDVATVTKVPEPEAAPASAVSQPAEAPRPATDATTSVDAASAAFESKVRPILEARCQPCHFPGGIMYERRPFDRPETITALGTKLFTRIKDENERRIISEFLAQQSP